MPLSLFRSQTQTSVSRSSFLVCWKIRPFLDLSQAEAGRRAVIVRLAHDSGTMSRMSTSPSPDRKATSNPSPAGGVQSVNRDLDVLEFIGSRHPDVPIGEIATGLRLPLPTCTDCLRRSVNGATRGNSRPVGTRSDFASCHSQSLLALSSARSPSASFSISSTNPVRRQIFRFLRAIRPSTVDLHGYASLKAQLSHPRTGRIGV
jgi:hypothetical protein